MFKAIGAVVVYGFAIYGFATWWKQLHADGKGGMEHGSPS